MEKHSRCVIDICDNGMQYQELLKKCTNVDGDIIMHKLPKNEAVKAAWINTIFEERQQLIQESLRTFTTTSLLL